MGAPSTAGLYPGDRILLWAGILSLAGFSWLYLFRLQSTSATEMLMPMMLPWSSAELRFTLVMWAVMMVAMMTPSAAPMVLTYASVQRQRAQSNRPAVPSFVFLAGYLAVWSAFSAAATLTQWALHASALLDPHSQAVAPWLGGVFLLATGIYQLTPAKDACLRHCRSPLEFLGNHWREGGTGAFFMGLHHGAYCVGCCWLLMILLFVAGVMNLLWVAALAVFVLLERVVPRGRVVAYSGAALMLAAGAMLLLRAGGGY